ncbi:non-homologous end-joining DNA ligase [Legionella impletisoli]|uniref:ATP-dependent DNA ligase n=1 Tax=Legionella impletisoli TaxID=343510 RepID=A0A917JMD1_9GAMM|nr:non-homologous end-joining DNA ligase [Legionella impletisoli]GGI76393.1 ATP-dependent DNA ligase [Legionella impletisoli]
MNILGVEISHPDKMLYPKSDVSKEYVAEYFNKISSYMLPFVKNRPITLKRYPNGIDEDGFFNKHRPDYFPDYVKNLTVPTKEDQSTMNMVGIESEKALVYLAGQDVIELHVALSTMSSLEKPDQIIFDFDPSDNDFEKVRTASKALKNLLDQYNLHSFVKTSGSRGLHVHIPIEPNHTFDVIKKLARNIAQNLHEQCPDITTLEQRKNKRGQNVFIDFLRNDYAMTAIAPYSLRAKEGAPVATPISWEEVHDQSLTPQSYTIKNIFRRLGQIDDPWENFNHYNRGKNLQELLD